MTIQQTPHIRAPLNLLTLAGSTRCRAAYAATFAAGVHWRNGCTPIEGRNRGSSFWLYKFDEWARYVDEFHRKVTAPSDRFRIGSLQYLRNEHGSQCPDLVLLARDVQQDCLRAAGLAGDYVRGPWVAEDAANVSRGNLPTEPSESAVNCVHTVLSLVDPIHARLVEQIGLWDAAVAADACNVPSVLPAMSRTVSQAKLTLRGVAAILKADTQRLSKDVEHCRGQSSSQMP